MSEARRILVVANETVTGQALIDAVKRRVGGMRFVEVPEQVVNEMRKRFGNGHSFLEETK